MKSRFFTLAVLLFLLVPSFAFAQKSRGRSSGGSVSVKGYTKKDGTYVSGHTRSSPGSRSSKGYYGGGSYADNSSSLKELEGTGITPHADDSWIFEGVKNNPANNQNSSKKKSTGKNEQIMAVPEKMSIEEQERLLKGTNSIPPTTENKANTTTKKKVLETKDVEAYGLAPEVKADPYRNESYSDYLRRSRSKSKTDDEPLNVKKSNKSKDEFEATIPDGHDDFYAPSTPSGSFPGRSNAEPSKSSSGKVDVKGYTRKDGTSVPSHTRSARGSGSKK